MMESIDQLLTEIHSERSQKAVRTTRAGRTRWSTKEELLFERLVACYGNDYSLLRSLMQPKTEKQIRKKYRQLLRDRSGRLDRLEREVAEARRKEYFDQLLQDDLSWSSQSSRSQLPDESLQSLQ